MAPRRVPKPREARRQIIFVEGAGDVGSAVAWLLFREGHAAVLLDGERPAVTRRRMAFADAAWDGSAELDGVQALRTADAAELDAVLAAGQALPLHVGPRTGLRDAIVPLALVDARMRKRETSGVRLAEAPLTIGLGPGFEAGVQVHVVVETAHGPRLGQALEAGRTLDYDGIPQEIEGTRRERHVRAASAGAFRTTLRIGDRVEAGATAGSIGGVPHTTSIAGVLRGLLRDGVRVTAGARLAEVVPDGAKVAIAGVGARPRRIAEGVLAVLAAHGVRGSRARSPYDVA